LDPFPSFELGIAVATVNVHFLTEAIGFIATFTTAGSVKAWNALTPGVQTTLLNETATGNIALTIGSNTIVVQSSVDPWTYTLTVNRAPSDITDIQLVVSGLSVTVPALSYTPGNVWSATTRYYSASVPYITDHVLVTATYTLNSDEITAQITGSGIDAQVLTSATGLSLPLAQGPNPVVFLSSLDGTYSQLISATGPRGGEWSAEELY
jgi:hypothetical protein